MSHIGKSSQESYSEVEVNKLVWSKYVYDSKCQRHFCQLTSTLKRTEQNLIVCIGKSEAEVTNNKRLLKVLYYRSLLQTDTVK